MGNYGRDALAPSDRRGGQALVEFALVLPVLILLVLIVLDFGRLYQSWVTLTNAARVGANYAASTGTYKALDPRYQALITNEMSGAACQLQPSGGPPPDPTFPNGTQLGDPAVVSLGCKFAFWTPLISDFFGGSGSLPLGASAQFPIRYGATTNLP
ncbi:MAG: TadE/TadG family type IV pilus assembly protein [Candidatus Limnocylindrales bacterium]